MINKSRAYNKIFYNLLFVLYFLLVTLDLYTTYITSPDLNYEWNPIIRYFNLNWTTIITLTYLLISIVFYLYILSFKNQLFKKTNKLTYIVDFLIIIAFTFHFTYSIFVVINNFLSFYYLNGKNQNLFLLSKKYVIFYNSLPGFFYFINALFLVMSLFLAKKLIKINH